MKVDAVKSFKHCQIILPGLQSDVPDLVYLPKLLARANKIPNTIKQLHKKLQHLLQWPGNTIPVAALAAAMHGMPAHEGAWMVAEITQLQADMSTVYCMGNHQVTFDDVATAAHFERLKPYLEADGIFLQVINRLQAILQHNQANTTTVPHSQVAGKNIAQKLPNDKYWQRLMTEVQMLWHDTPEANGVWFWGEGAYSVPETCIWDHIWGDGLLAQSIASGLKLPYDTLSLTSDIKLLASNASHDLVIIENLQQDETLHQLDAHLFKPLWQAFKSRQLDALSFWFGTPNDYQLTTSGRMKFWRRTQPLSEYL